MFSGLLDVALDRTFVMCTNFLRIARIRRAIQFWRDLPEGVYTRNMSRTIRLRIVHSGEFRHLRSVSCCRRR